MLSNHLAALSAYALTSSAPMYVFSPMETRLRETQPLHLALHHAIPISMYACPEEVDLPTSISVISPIKNHGEGIGTSGARGVCWTKQFDKLGGVDQTRYQDNTDGYKSQDPVATLTIMAADTIDDFRLFAIGSLDPQIYRIPLWALVPVLGTPYGSTASWIGICLTDFSAVNLFRDSADIAGNASATTCGSVLCPWLTDQPPDNLYQ